MAQCISQNNAVSVELLVDWPTPGLNDKDSGMTGILKCCSHHHVVCSGTTKEKYATNVQIALSIHCKLGFLLPEPVKLCSKYLQQKQI